MPYKKLNNITYPIPSIATAVETLRPGWRWFLTDEQTSNAEWTPGNPSDEDLSKNIDRGENHELSELTWDEVQAEITREQAIYDHYEYERTRKENYPSIENQLDLLYHDIENGLLGIAATTGSWYVGISSVKTSNPKPAGDPPT